MNDWSKIISLLANHIFHVTKFENIASILAQKKIVASIDNRDQFTFGYSSNSYFKNRNCVSLFDFVNTSEGKIQTQITKCHPIQPLLNYKAIGIFILKKESYCNIIPWNDWKIEEAYSEMIVPYIEAGYPNQIDITDIAELIIVQKI